jgi:hypothetical protein
MANIPLRGVSSSSGVRVRAVLDQPTYAARLWATQQRDPVANPLPRPLLRLTGADVPLGVALYAMAIYDEHHPGAFEEPFKPAPSGGRPSGGGGPGDRPHRQAFLQASHALSQAEGATLKRKELETVTERPAKRQVTSSQVAARSFASEPSQADWDALIEEMAQGPGSATRRLQHVMSRLQGCFPLGSDIAPRLPPADFLQLQQLLLEYGSDTAPPVPDSNRQLLELCCRVLLLAAIRLNRQLANLVLLLMHTLVIDAQILPACEKRWGSFTCQHKDLDEDPDDGSHPSAAPGGPPPSHLGRRLSPLGASPRRQAPPWAVLERTMVPPLLCWLWRPHRCWRRAGLPATCTRRDP